MNKYVELALKGVIISSTMITTNEVVDYYDLFQVVNKGGNKLAARITGSSLGYVLGKKIAKEIVSTVNDAITAYHGEEETDG